jgi:hypothetical protein
MSPKFDKNYPMKYFLESYAGGPFSNLEVRKPVNHKDIVKAALRIQTMFRIYKAKKKRRELTLSKER